MVSPADINPRIVESLYCEALALADEVRACFAPESQRRGADWSCEGLRTTTRVMHCLAWLLNHRAFFAGEISAFQLRRHGRLAVGLPPSDTAGLPLDVARTVRDSERLYARIVRLEQAWRGSDAAPQPSAIDKLRERLAAR